MVKKHIHPEETYIISLGMAKKHIHLGGKETYIISLGRVKKPKSGQNDILAQWPICRIYLKCQNTVFTLLEKYKENLDFNHSHSKARPKVLTKIAQK
jgi:hypothetical protein